MFNNTPHSSMHASKQGGSAINTVSWRVVRMGLYQRKYRKDAFTMGFAGQGEQPSGAPLFHTKGVGDVSNMSSIQNETKRSLLELYPRKARVSGIFS